jgi:hypothetical protein
MKLLLENWRRYLNEGIDPRIKKQINKLLKVPNMGILIKKYGYDFSPMYQIKYVFFKDDMNDQYHDQRYINQKATDEAGLGSVTIQTGDPSVSIDDAPCFDGFTVYWSEAKLSMGALLYEVALEIASREGGGLAPDRSSVSEEAIAVWEKYAKRSGISVKQMDVVHGAVRNFWTTILVRDDDDKPVEPIQHIGNDDLEQLTPNYSFDDCNQASSIEDKGKEDWMNSPASRIYRKDEAEVILYLKQAGRLILRDEVSP